MRRLTLSLVAVATLVTGMARAETALLGGRRAKVIDAPGSAADSAQIIFARDPALLSLPNPLCPSTTVVRIDASSGSTGEISLPCTGWKVAGSTYRYSEPTGIAGGITQIVLKFGGLKITARGSGFASIGLPDGHLQASLSVNGASYCGRFPFPKHLTPTASRFQGPSIACPGPAPTPTPSPAPPPISNVSLVDTSDGDIPNEYNGAAGNCYRGRRHNVGLVLNNGTSLQVRFAQSVAADCETTFGDYSISMNSGYRVGFDVTCPFGRPYRLYVLTQISGAHTVQHDSGDGCNAAIPGSGTAYLSGVTGSYSGGTLTSGTLNLAQPPILDTDSSTNWGFAESSVGWISGTGLGAPIHHELAFSWGASCRSYGGAIYSGDECAVRLGLASEVSPNGNGGCMDADDYPGDGGRDPNADGQTVFVSAFCE